MGRIIVLDELTASQIAAGEVIERPASVVKETVENSVDAGATSVTVEIRSGGIKYIRVTDNGSGFEPDDAVIAFDKHATSKIRSGEDLMSVSTLGFRGEALASIAAVADVELLSRTESEEQGVYVHIRGGDVLECSRRGSPKGTVLTVRDLFYNVPARYKFLKKDQTEAAYVAETVQMLALANPDVAFRLISGGQELLRTPGSGLEAAVFSIFGREAMKDLLPVAYTDGENTVKGFTGVRDCIFGTRGRQFFFVNGRSVKSRLLASALDEAYSTVTMKHRFPMCVLNVSVPLSKLDVNVHPAKTEVRFASERAVFGAVLTAVINALLSENRSAPEPAENRVFSRPVVENPVENRRETWKTPVVPVENRPVELEIPPQTADVTPRLPDIPPRQFGQTPAQPNTLPTAPETPAAGTVYERVDPAPYEVADNKTETGVYEQAGIAPSVEGPTAADVPATGTYNETDVYTRGRIIGQYLKTYILLEIDGELAVIDQHAAHERIKYEAICAAMDRADAALPVSPMLIPATVRLTAAEKLWLNDNIDSFTAAGFEIDDFGPDTVIVRAVPSALSEADPEEMLLEGIRAAMSAKGPSQEVFRTEALDTMACKAAIKANHALTFDEIRGLLASLANLKNSATCPHGRPIVIRIKSHELEKRFKRCL
ncbi:MAG: DNA mismatch repair endonuclease MutL [Clostridia bacterium]|nr:DNA mismatch repair endonuclease MutL [Clostridia bacterium]